MILFKNLNQTGDTIIEVMLSMSLLTMFLFLSWGITNKATQIGMNSRKRIEMVNSMKEQAEIIKAQYNNDSYGINKIVSLPTQATSTGLDENPCSVSVAQAQTFYFNISGSSLNQENKKKLMPDTGNEVWVQYKPNKETDPDYYDFYVRACWQTVGSIQNTDSSQFIVRLNAKAP